MPEPRHGVSAILHAWRWPEAAVVGRLADTLRRAAALRPLQIIEAREQTHAAVGAAALVNAAVNRSTHPLVLVATPDRAWSVAQLDRVLCASEHRLVILSASLWALPRLHFDRLGGLDERFWSVGEVDDLAARAAALGIEVDHITEDAPSCGPAPYPLRREVRDFLETRNRLLTAFKVLPADRLGRAILPDVEAALRDAAEAAGLSPELFAIGSPARPTPANLRDARGTLTRLLALDSLLTELTAGTRP